MDSSDDDVPIGARPVLQAATKMIDLDGDSNASGSPMPEWLSQHTPAQKGVPSPDSDDSDDVVDLSTPAAERKADSRNAAPGGGGKDGKPQTTAQPPATAAAAKKSSVKKAAGGLPPVGMSQAAASVAAAPETAAIGGAIPLTMPEKLTKGRFLVELEATEGGATDLAGDAGAVGRFSLSGGAGREGDMLLDLKGCIYNASTRPCATTLCIVNLQPAEAKVEALFDSFVSLREEVVQGGSNAGGPNDYFMYDDDDGNYQIDEGGEAAKKPGGKRKAGQEATEGGGGATKKRKVAPKPKSSSKGNAAKKKQATKPGGKGGGKKK